MSSVGVTFANRVLGLRLAPALQIDKAKVVPVFYSHSCQNAYSRQHPFAELCANSEHGDGKDAILHDKKVESWRQDPERKNQYRALSYSGENTPSNCAIAALRRR